MHQHAREDSRELFAKVREALVPGGRIMIRDVVMEPDRIAPPEGALFAVNMLVATASGGTFTMDEFVEDLQASGFHDVKLLVKDEWMNSVVAATKSTMSSGLSRCWAKGRIRSCSIMTGCRQAS